MGMVIQDANSLQDMPHLTHSQPQTKDCGQDGAKVDGKTSGRDAGPEKSMGMVIQHANSLQNVCKETGR